MEKNIDFTGRGILEQIESSTTINYTFKTSEGEWKELYNKFKMHYTGVDPVNVGYFVPYDNSYSDNSNIIEEDGEY